MTLIAIVATINGVIVQIIMAARVLYGLAAQGHIAPILADVHPRTRTPLNATLLATAIVLVLAVALPLDRLAEWTSRLTLVAVRARQRRPHRCEGERGRAAGRHLRRARLGTLGRHRQHRGGAAG